MIREKNQKGRGKTVKIKRIMPSYGSGSYDVSLTGVNRQQPVGMGGGEAGDGGGEQHHSG